jgi:hypothetical protein
MRWKLPWPKPAALKLAASGAGDDEQPDGWQRHIEALRQAGIPEPGSAVRGRKPATEADEQALYEVAPSFVELLPWVEFLPESRSMLLEDGQSVAAFFELVPLGTEGREPGWLAHARDALENALQDSFDELDENPWVLQLYAQDEPSFDQYMQTLRDYVQPRARGTAFTEFYLRFFGHHLRAVAKPGGLFEDTVVTRLRWRGQTRRVRMVVYRRASRAGKPPRPDARADAEHRLRPPVWRAGERRHPGPAHGRGRRPRLAAAVVQPAPHDARAQYRGPGALLRTGALPGRD